MGSRHPRCPKCNGLLQHQQPGITGPEKVHCLLCGWEYIRKRPPCRDASQCVSMEPQKPSKTWIDQALSARNLILKSISRRTVMSEGTNTLSHLNDALFEQMNRLSNSKGDALKTEIERTRAMSGLAKEMISNATLALEAHRTLGGKGDTPGMLKIGEK